MGIAAIANDYWEQSYKSAVGKESVPGVDKTESFGQTLQAETEKKCPYSFLAKDGVIQYNGVTFVCDYNQNAITLGNMYEKDKVLRIALPSGGSLHVNIDKIDDLARAADMFTPEDLNAIMRAIHEYNHCTRKRLEIEEEKVEEPAEAAAESETPDVEKDIEEDENSLVSQINAFRTELYYKLINNETEIKIRIGSQEMSLKEWDKLMDRVDKELENIHEALLEKEKKQAEKEKEEKIRKLFEERNNANGLTDIYQRLS
ncbi:hypothetical protein D6853_05500 [Butyrivibrio sp. X503]|uniref:hypothetical protein n=1 Tax=Butyrivibrio sp. X503 TaxID=2364878 RepID=UPI000EA8A955|nr:hypothetical protein [Butyrivibrio sp. X503]RKM56249.1 hypothetical protein D6853_05500 [Butyrivibrio sp. X503]